MSPSDQEKLDRVQLESGWKDALQQEFLADYFQQIKDFLVREKKTGKIIYPPAKLIFNALNTTPFDEVKAVIIGQDPYHRPNQAMGLSFSVPQGIAIPPSLRNIYKEIHADVGCSIPNHGDLTSWAKQGVLLLNAALTVEQGKASSHLNIGWQRFTNAIIAQLSTQRAGIVFMLWGNFAKSKKGLIDTQKHLVLEAAHPSPLARNAFSGCRHFSKCNEHLRQSNKQEINWQL